jgi:hypothetical protein
MRTRSMVLGMMLAPASLLAQGTGSAKAKAHANTQAGAHADAHAAMNADAQVRVPASFDANARGKLQATYARAREHNVPQAAIEHRVAEGQAKGASDAAILMSSSKVEANMEAAQAAMVKAGHQPTDKEVEGGAYAMERGVTSAQITTMTTHAPNGRSLDVAFDVLTKLSEKGIPVTNALEQVQAKLDAHASDAAMTSLVTKAKGGVGIGGR